MTDDRKPPDGRTGKRGRRRGRTRMIAAIATTLVALPVAGAEAATLTVTSTADAGAGTLRQRILEANSIAFPGPDVIDASGVGGTINLQSALPGLSSGIEIVGPGASSLTVRRDAGGTYSIFDIAGGATIMISGLTITNGSRFQGGGIVSFGTATIEDSVVTGNTATQGGAGLANGGTMTVRNSVVSGNTADVQGGAYAGLGTLTIENSTLSGNNAPAAAAIENQGTATIVNSTVSGNTATTTGGGIRNSANATLILRNSTLSGNTAPAGANLTNVASGGAATLLRSTIIANPLGGGPNCTNTGTIVSQGFNLESANSCVLGQSTDLPNTDPGLGALGSHGGPTQTLPLNPGSAAIDKGFADTLTADQRGSRRPADFLSIPNPGGGDGADIGAFEVQGSEPPATVSITGGPEGLTADVRPSFAFEVANALVVECSLDSGAPSFGACSDAAGHTPPDDLPDGSYSFRVRATGDVLDYATASRSFTVDTTPPETRITKRPKRRLVARGARVGVRFAFKSSEPGSTFTCKLDRKTPRRCRSPFKTKVGAGKHKFRVSATDRAGNADPTPAKAKLRVSSRRR